jgi:hypothetical protein
MEAFEGNLGRLGSLKPLGITIKDFNKTIVIKDVVNKQLRVLDNRHLLQRLRNYYYSITSKHLRGFK